MIRERVVTKIIWACGERRKVGWNCPRVVRQVGLNAT